MIFIDMYERRDYCCDPYKVHSSKFKNNLRIVKLELAEEFKNHFSDINLSPGDKLCNSCRIKVQNNIEVRK